MPAVRHAPSLKLCFPRAWCACADHHHGKRSSRRLGSCRASAQARRSGCLGPRQLPSRVAWVPSRQCRWSQGEEKAAHLFGAPSPTCLFPPHLAGTQEPAADWSELPQPLLTRILGLLPPALGPLLVCKGWLAAALDCSRWWERCFLGMFLVTNLIDASGPAGEIIAAKRAPGLTALLASPGGFDALLSGFGKRAAHCRHMAIDELVGTVLVPQLLAAAKQGSPNLAKLDLRGTFEGPGDVERVMQASQGGDAGSGGQALQPSTRGKRLRVEDRRAPEQR